MTQTSTPKVGSQASTPSFDDSLKVNWYRCPIEKAELQKLMRRNDLRGWLQTGCHLGLFFITGFLAYFALVNITLDNWTWSLPLALTTLFIHGTIGPFMGLIAIHELQHRTVFESRSLNAFFEKIYAFISWSDYIWYQESHRRHHMTTCHKQSDGEVVLPVKFTFKRWQFWLGALAWDPRATWQRLRTVWGHANGRVSGDWYQHVLPRSDSKLRTRHQAWARVLLFGHGGLSLIFLLSGHWFLIIVFTFGTFYCNWLGFLCGRPQHFGLNPDIPDFRVNTRTFTCSWLPAFYYWNMQYHLEHHMYPAVPFYNLSKLRKAIEGDLPPCTHGLWNTWQDLIQIKKMLVADPSYRYIPELPNRSTATLDHPVK